MMSIGVQKLPPVSVKINQKITISFIVRHGKGAWTKWRRLVWMQGGRAPKIGVGISGHVTFATCLLNTQNKNNAPDRPSRLVPYDSTQLKPLP